MGWRGGGMGHTSADSECHCLASSSHGSWFLDHASPGQLGPHGLFIRLFYVQVALLVHGPPCSYNAVLPIIKLAVLDLTLSNSMAQFAIIFDSVWRDICS